MKIAIIGFSGAGKSTLAAALGTICAAPVLHLDCVHWMPGWQERPLKQEQAQVEAFLNTHGAWVIDGNYTRTCHERRMEEADEIVFLDLPRFSCFVRALRRYAQCRGKARSSMTPGCEEKMDAEFILWLLVRGRTKARRQTMTAPLARYPQKAVVLRSQREIDRYLEKKRAGKAETQAVNERGHGLS